MLSGRSALWSWSFGGAPTTEKGSCLGILSQRDLQRDMEKADMPWKTMRGRRKRRQMGRVQPRKKSEMRQRGGVGEKRRRRRRWRKGPCREVVAPRKVGKREREGRESVDSIPGGRSGWLGKGRRWSRTFAAAAADEERWWRKKGTFAGVVMRVTRMLREERLAARWRRGIVWPLDKKGKMRT